MSRHLHHNEAAVSPSHPDHSLEEEGGGDGDGGSGDGGRGSGEGMRGDGIGKSSRSSSGGDDSWGRNDVGG